MPPTIWATTQMARITPMMMPMMTPIPILMIHSPPAAEPRSAHYQCSLESLLRNRSRCGGRKRRADCLDGQRTGLLRRWGTRRGGVLQLVQQRLPPIEATGTEPLLLAVAAAHPDGGANHLGAARVGSADSQIPYEHCSRRRRHNRRRMPLTGSPSGSGRSE